MEVLKILFWESLDWVSGKATKFLVKSSGKFGYRMINFLSNIGFFSFNEAISILCDETGAINDYESSYSNKEDRIKYCTSQLIICVEEEKIKLYTENHPGKKKIRLLIKEIKDKYQTPESCMDLFVRKSEFFKFLHIQKQKAKKLKDIEEEKKSLRPNDRRYQELQEDEVNLRKYFILYFSKESLKC